MPHYGPGVDSASNRNMYQEHFLGGKDSRFVRLTILPPSCADCLEICEPQIPGILEFSGPAQACKGTAVLSVTHKDLLLRGIALGRIVTST